MITPTRSQPGHRMEQAISISQRSARFVPDYGDFFRHYPHADLFIVLSEATFQACLAGN